MAIVQVLALVTTLTAAMGAAFLATKQVLIREWDHGLRAAARAVAAELPDQPSLNDDPDWLEEAINENRPADARIEVQTAEGQFLGAAGQGLRLSSRGNGCRNQRDYRVCEVSSGRFVVLASRSREREDENLGRFMTVTTIAAVVSALAAALLSRAVVTRALAPLSKMAARIAGIRLGAGERLGDDQRFTELRLLATSFDGMIERVDEALARERRFAAEASHELRTPLTVLRGEIEALANDQGTQSGAGRALRSVDDLVALVEALLWLSRANTTLDRSRLEVVNLAEMVRDQIRRSEALHPGRVPGAALPDEVLVRADEHLLARAVANLLDNALKYSQEPVALALEIQDGMALVRVEDHGPGVLPELRERIFEPFFRGGKERAETPGFGLGLPLARAVARAHGGDILLDRTGPSGSRFELSIPLV
jgi:two-component system OmpR family sensor kinase